MYAYDIRFGFDLVCTFAHFAFDIVTSLSISFAVVVCVVCCTGDLFIPFRFNSFCSAFIVFLNALDGGDDVRLCTCALQLCLII